MKIFFSPQRREGTLEAFKNGDTITINGELFDFTPLAPDHAVPVDNEWFAEDVKNVGTVLTVTLVLPHGPNPPDNVAFPAPIPNVPNGKVSIPS